MDAHDAPQVLHELEGRVPVLTWQRVGALQLDAIAGLRVSDDLKLQLRQYVKAHYAHHSVEIDSSDRIPDLAMTPFNGTRDRYAPILDRPLPGGVRGFLLGSEACLCARQGTLPEPPYGWLREEPSIRDVFERHKQGKPIQLTSDREVPYWRLSWSPGPVSALP